MSGTIFRDRGGVECVAGENGEVLWMAKKAKAWGQLDDQHLAVATMIGLVLLRGTQPCSIIPELFGDLAFHADGKVIAGRRSDGTWWLIGVKEGQLTVLAKKRPGDGVDDELLAKLAKFDPAKAWKKEVKTLEAAAAGGFGWVATADRPPPPPARRWELVAEGATFTIAIDGPHGRVVAKLPEPLMGAGHDSPLPRQRYMLEHALAVAIAGDVALVAAPGERAFEVDLRSGAGTKISDLWKSQCGWMIRGAFAAPAGWAVLSQERLLAMPRGGEVTASAIIADISVNRPYDLEGASDAVILGDRLLVVASSSHEHSRIKTYCLAHPCQPWLDFQVPLYRARLTSADGRLFAHDATRCLELRGVAMGLRYFEQVFCGGGHKDAFAPDWAAYREA